MGGAPQEPLRPIQALGPHGGRQAELGPHGELHQQSTGEGRLTLHDHSRNLSCYSFKHLPLKYTVVFSFPVPLIPEVQMPANCCYYYIISNCCLQIGLIQSCLKEVNLLPAMITPQLRMSVDIIEKPSLMPLQIN